MIERTLLMIKPDGVRRGITGEVISRVEQKGLKIVNIKKIRFDEALARKFYAVHRDRPFFNDLVAFVISGDVVPMIVEGDSAVAVVRRLIGPTNASEAPPGTIRGDFANSVQENAVHASDSAGNADYEISLIFG